MNRRVVSGIMLTLLMVSILTLAFETQEAKADGTNYLRADGSIDSTTAPFFAMDSITQASAPDLAVVGAGPARMRIPDPFFGMVMPVVAVVENQDTWPENFNVSIFYDTILIGMSTVTPEDWWYRTEVSFSWDLELLPQGAYTISANASVQAGETDTADNYFVDGEVRKTFDGDVTADGIVDVFDLFDLSKSYESTTLLADINSDGIVDWTDWGLMIIAYGSTEGRPNWNPYADFDKDGYIGSADYGVFATNFGLLGSPNWNPYADMNADNEIGLPDLVELSKHYGKTYP